MMWCLIRRRAGAARSCSRRFVLTTVLALAILMVLVPSAGAQPPNLTGEWIVTTDSLSTYQLRTSIGRQTLTATWSGDYGSHAGLVGSFTGTLNASGTAYSGPMHVSEAGNSVSGTMTFTISSRETLGYPLLDVSYQQDNGVAGSFRLEIYLLPPRVAPNGEGARFDFSCPVRGGSDASCEGAEAQAVGTGSALSRDHGTTSRGSRPLVLGDVRFSVRAGHRRAITVPLNRRGRRLLAQRHVLRLRIVLHLKRSLHLPAVQTVGTIVLHRG